MMIIKKVKYRLGLSGDVYQRLFDVRQGRFYTVLT